jgi:hypothetical protein
MPAIPLRLAAAALGRSEATLRRWIQRGAPCARPGASGRGKGALVEVADLRAWRRAAPLDCDAFLDRLESILRDYHRAGDHRLVGLRDDHARAYLAALVEYVRGRFAP